MTIHVLNMATDYADRSRQSCGFSCSYPWVRVTDRIHPDQETAYRDAVEWLTQYIREAPYARMGAALGVAERPGGYVGVVNYYHSNT